uniref:Uncharacterized protein n=1 Tax=Anguilla anguilla TaxID=7936 RepID=A0A0E9PJM3_ANGAN
MSKISVRYFQNYECSTSHSIIPSLNSATKKRVCKYCTVRTNTGIATRRRERVVCPCGREELNPMGPKWKTGCSLHFFNVCIMHLKLMNTYCNR